MKTLGRNIDNDLYLAGANLAMVSDAEAQCAIIESIISTQRGELQFDDEAGIDYFGTVFRNPSYIPVWASQVQSQIEALSWVSSVDDFTYNFDRSNSTLIWSMTVVTTSGERLDLQNKQIKVAGVSSVNVDWNDIYDKPDGTDTVISSINAMADKVQKGGIDELKSSDSMAKVKEALNAIIFDSRDEGKSSAVLLTFTFAGFPVGAVLNCGPLKIKSTTPVEVNLSDGTSTTWAIDANGYAIVEFPDKTEETGKKKHIFLKSGTVTMTLRGEITGIEVDADYYNGIGKPVGPIFANNSGSGAFQYLAAFKVGEGISLDTVGDGAFKGFVNLATIQWNSATDVSFGTYAFAGCSSLTDLNWLPKNLTVPLSEGCFSGCSSLIDISGLSKIAKADNINVLPDKYFYGCALLSSVAGLPNHIETLGKETFSFCSRLKDLDGLPDSIESLGESCFAGCTGITKILYLPADLTTIGEGCFKGDTSLVSVWLPDSISAIGSGAFHDCTALTNVLCEANYSDGIDRPIFNQDELNIFVPPTQKGDYEGSTNWKGDDNSPYVIREYGTITLETSTITAGRTFRGNTGKVISESIWSINYGDGTRPDRFESSTDVIPAHTYAGADAAANIVITGYIKEIAGASENNYPLLATGTGNSFWELTSITMNNIPLEKIGDYCFSDCRNLNSISLGQSETTGAYCLGAYAFRNCEKITSLDWLTAGLGKLKVDDVTQPAFGEGCFQGSGVVALDYANEDVTSLPKNCFRNTKLASLSEIGSIVASLGEYCFAECISLTDIEAIANTGVTGLPAYCFYGCSALQNIDGSGWNKIVSLGKGCFSSCSTLTSIGFIANTSEDLTALPDECFRSCTALTSLDGIEDKITSLGEACFRGCAALQNIAAIGLKTDSDSGRLVPASKYVSVIPPYCFAECSGLQSLVGAVGVTRIETYAFFDATGLKTTSGLGPSITSIAELAFYRCTGLRYISMVALVPPTLNANSFYAVGVQNIPLYVREEAVSAYSTAPYWSQFSSISARTIKLSLSDFAADVTIDGSKGVLTCGYAWYADLDDGNGVRQYYLIDDEEEDHLPDIQYGSRNDRIITLYGDIKKIGTESGFGFLTKKADGTKVLELSKVYISSPFLQEIGAGCFEGYSNLANLSISMMHGGTIGNEAFKNCTSLPSAGCDSTVGVLGQYAFAGCTLLADISGMTGVTAIGAHCFDGDTSITSLASLTSVVSVGDNAFQDCTGITTTSGLSKLQSLGESAFSGCTGLVTVQGFGSALSSIGDEAFAGCPNITAVFMAVLNPPYLPADAFTDDVFHNAILYVPAGSNAGNETYVNVYKATPNWNKFQSAQGESHIQVRSIDFTLTDIIRNYSLRAGQTKVTATDTWTIDYGDGESSYTYGAGETILGTYTFKTNGTGEEKKKVIRISGAVTDISAASDSAYPILSRTSGRNENLTAIASSAAMEIVSFGASAFRECHKLESVTNVPSVTAIGVNCFSGCGKLTDISGLSNVTTIGDGAFTSCSSLKDVYGFDSVVTIGSRAFSGCTQLEYIDGFGLNLTSIGERAFANCTALKEVQMLMVQPPTIGANAFENVDMTTVPLYVPRGSIADYKANAVWGAFENITYRYVELGLATIVGGTTVGGNGGGVKSVRSYWAVDWGDESGLVGSPGIASSASAIERFPSHTYTISGAYNIKIYGRINTIEGELESGAEPTKKAMLSPIDILKQVSAQGANSTLATVGAYAFVGATALESVTLPSVTVIGESVFEGCTALISTVGLVNVEHIGDKAFKSCTSLKDVVGGPRLADIGDEAFAGCSSIANVRMANRIPPILPVSNDYPMAAGGTAFIDTPMVPPSESDTPIYVASVKNYLADRYDDRDNVWSVWGDNIVAQDLVFYFKDVPKGLTLVSGTSYVEAGSEWSITWSCNNDEEVVTEEFSAATRNLPTHTFTWDSTEQTRDYTVTLSGGITKISAASPVAYPFFATAAGAEFPYLASIECAEGMGVKEIGDYTFRGCTLLTKVKGLAQTEKIGDYAFYGCSLLSNISGFADEDGGVAEVGDYAFAECPRLANLAGLEWATHLGAYAFQNCTKVTSIAQIGSLIYSKLEPSPEDDAERVAIESFFGSYCFSGCSLRMIESQYIRPPSIDETTFIGLDPANTLVFVPKYSSEEHKVPAYPSASGESLNETDSYSTAVEAYRHAEVWKEFWRGIMVKSYIDLTFKIPVGGGEVKGAEYISQGITYKSSISYNNTYTVDWGDGSPVEVYGEPGQGPMANQTMPSHTYAAQGDYTVKIGGDVIALEGAYKADSEASALPCFVVETGGSLLASCLTYVKIESTSALAELGSACFARCTGLTGCTIENEALTTLGNAVFYKCTSLGSFTAQNFVPSAMPDYAFANCSSLGGITVKGWSELTEIGSSAFYECAQLQSLNSSDGTKMSALKSIGANAFETCSNLTALDFSSLTSLETIGEKAFCGVGTATTEGFSLVFPDIPDVSPEETAITVGENAFKGSAVTSISISGSYKISLAAAAFKDCANLTSINSNFIAHIKDNTIPANCFRGCISLTGIDLSSLRNIEEFAFYGCAGLQGTLTIPDIITTVEKWAFARCGMSEVAFTSTGVLNLLDAIPDWCFFCCDNLTTITFDTGVLIDKLGKYAFACCDKLGNVKIPYTITEIDEGCFLCAPDFKKATGVEEVEVNIDNKVNSYNFLGYSFNGEQAIAPGGHGLTSFIWEEDPDNQKVYTIGKGCFLGCTQLNTAQLPDQIKPDSQLDEPLLPAYLFYGCRALTKVTSTSKKEDVGNFLPTSIKQIGDYCFTWTTNLRAIMLHNGIISLGVGCFSQSRQFIYYNTMPTVANSDRYASTANDWLGDDKWIDNTEVTVCGLEQFTWEPPSSGSSASAIGLGCFDGCIKLATVSIPTNLTQLPEFCFYDCRSLSANPLDPADGLAFLSGTALTTIGRYCFARSGIQNVKGMPSTMEIVSEGAFSRCPNIDTTEGFKVSSGDSNFQKGVFKNCESLVEITGFPEVAKLPAETFMGCTALTTVSLPSSIVALGDSCFEGCASLYDLSQFSDVQVIGARCFAGLTSQNFVSFNGLQFVNDYTTECFAGCTNLININALSIPGAERTYQSAISIYTNQVSTGIIQVNFTIDAIGLRSGWQIATFDLLTRELQGSSYWGGAVGKTLQGVITKGDVHVCTSEVLTLASLTGASTFQPEDAEQFGINRLVFPAENYSSSEQSLKAGIEYTLTITSNYAYGIGIRYASRNPDTNIYIVGDASYQPIVRVSGRLVATPMLGVRAFANCPIEKIDFSSYDYKIGYVSDSEEKEPFKDCQESKGDIRLIVPVSQATAYNEDDYWKQFKVVTPNSVTVTTRNANDQVQGAGLIRLATGVDSFVIGWGDGSFTNVTPVDGAIDLSSVQHTYTSAGTYTVSFF